MKKITIILLIFLVTISLVESVSAQTSQLEVDAFIKKSVGDDYFSIHYTYSGSTKTKSSIKALYNFSYPPYVANFPMTIFYDTETKGLSGKEISKILLTPQSFSIDKDEATTFALREDLVPSNNYQSELLLDFTTDNRFAWDITSLEALSNEGKYVNNVYRIILDVESGRVLNKITIQPLAAIGGISKPAIEPELRPNTQFLVVLIVSLIGVGLIVLFIMRRQRRT